MTDTTLTGTILEQVSRGMGLFPETGKLLIAFNPACGKVSTAKARRELVRQLEPLRPFPRKRYTLLYSRYPGQLRELVDAHCREIWEVGDVSDGGAVTIASCGGDGTHAETLASAEPWAERGLRVTVVRWPFGTGNDAADGATVEALLERLTAPWEPATAPWEPATAPWEPATTRRVSEVTVPAQALTVTTRRGVVYHAYNIASIGVDAFITDLTVKLRHIVPGNIYRRVADVSVLFYEQLIGVAPMRVTYDGRGGSGLLEGRFMLLAVGAGAPRTYGNQMRVLPDHRNLCAIERGHIGRKVVMKRRFYAGRHIHDRRTHMAEARSVTVAYGRRIPMQLDGEPFWLTGEEFPVTVRVEPGLVRVLPPVRSDGRLTQDSGRA